MADKKKYRLGLALSGGGAKGFAHVGVMKALDYFGLKPDIVAGVSAGSIMAAFYCGGAKPDDMLNLFAGIKVGDLTKVSIPSDGLFKFDKFKQFLNDNLPIKRIEDLLIPNIICATNLDTYKEELFTQGDLADCVIASSSLPVIFKPAKVNGQSFIDGGILHNMPSYALRDQCDYVLGVNVSPLDDITPFKSTIADIAYRSYRLMTTHNSIPDLQLCDVVIQVDAMKSSSTFGINKMKDNMKEGYFTAMKTLINSPLLNQLRDEQRQ